MLGSIKKVLTGGEKDEGDEDAENADPCMVSAVSFLTKVRGTLRRNFFEHRAHLHRTLYKHRVSQKIEMHMLDILKHVGDLTMMKVPAEGAVSAISFAQ